MASPSLFNDPFDCSINFQSKELTENEIGLIRSGMLNSDRPQRFKEIVNQQCDENFKNVLENAAINALKQSKDEFLLTNGVCCFSETNTDLLMWGHYSDGFKGFCLEFNTEFEPFIKLHKVVYSDLLPIINIFDLFSSDTYTFVTDLYCTKSQKWQYEREWRVLHKNAGTLFHYAPECLKGIYFGPNIDYALFEILCLILIGQNPNVELWKGQLSENEFNITFNKIYYTPYISAKAMGLVK